MRLALLYRIGRLALLGFVAIIPASTFEPASPQPSAAPVLINTVLDAPLRGGSLIASGLERFPQWNRVRRFMLDQHSFRSDDLRQWLRWAASLRELPERERLAAINAGVNARFEYANDQVVWHRANYWEDPMEVVREGRTDCEGFAVLKMFLAIAAGIDRKDLAIVVGRIPASGVYHAVLFARVGHQSYALDNRWSRLRGAGQAMSFTPLYALDSAHAWSYPSRPALQEARLTAAR